MSTFSNMVQIPTKSMFQMYSTINIELHYLGLMPCQLFSNIFNAPVLGVDGLPPN